MSKARIEVLKLVAEGKITPEDAERILRGIDDQAEPETSADDSARSARLGDAISQVLEQVGDTVRNAVGDAVGTAHRVFEEHRPGTEGVGITSGGFDLPPGVHLKVQPAFRVSFGGTSRGGNLVIRSVGEGRVRIVRGEAVEAHRSGNDYVLTWAKGNLEIEIPASIASLEARCMGGDLAVHEFRGPMALETMGGELHVLGVRSSFRARTLGGRVRIDDLELREGFSIISTTGGDVEIGLAKSSSVTLRAGTIGGVIDFPPGTESERAGRAKRRASAVLGDGKAELRVDTLGGDVRVRLI